MEVHCQNVKDDPQSLFRKIDFSQKTDEELATLSTYELAPFPLSLFDKNGYMRKPTTSLFDLFEESRKSIDSKNTHYILDGGFLLHRGIWTERFRNSFFSDICMIYVQYIQRHYGKNCTVVFDGYSDPSDSTRRVEQNRRRAGRVVADIQVTEEMRATLDLEDFLSNTNNKRQLITLLSAKLVNNNIAVKQSKDDADALIVRTANEKSAVQGTVAIVGEDIDLLVLLVALAPPDKDIYFLRHVDRNHRVYSSQELQNRTGLANSILFLHAFSGCDTTSAIWKKGKTSSVKLFQRYSELQNIPEIFNDPESLHEAVAQAGKRFFLRLYGENSEEESLQNHRFNDFLQLRERKGNIASLPPTEAAAEQHCYRVYHQVQKWMENDLPPKKWGWELLENCLVPIRPLRPAAPEPLLNLIFCDCTTGCGPTCECKKPWMNCTKNCSVCYKTRPNGTNPSITSSKRTSSSRVNDTHIDTSTSSNSTVKDGPSVPKKSRR